MSSENQCGSVFNTLAQSGTGVITKRSSNLPELVKGKGSDICDDKGLKNKGKKKFLTSALMQELIKIAEEDGNIKMQKAFWNTYYCHNEIKSAGGRSYGDYCKNRFCAVCSNNRRAELIRLYLPVLETWKEPQFVTLSVRTPTVERLDIYMKGVARAIRKIYLRFKQRHKRGKGIKMVAIWSIECNFNPMKKTYNPHVHMIFQDNKMAVSFAREWLKIWTKKHAGFRGQNIQTIRDREKTLIEVIKYSTKIFTEPDPNKKDLKAPRAIYLAAIYQIILSMKGMRIFGRFGFNLPDSSVKKREISLVNNVTTWKYDIKQKDWVDGKETKLTKYLPDSRLLAMLSTGINTEMK